MNPFESLRSLNISPRSVAESEGVSFAFTSVGGRPSLAALAPKDADRVLAEFQGTSTEVEGRRLFLGPAEASNAAALRKRLPFLATVPLGLKTSAGFGDRLGLATPGHIRALRAVGGRIAPVFAQQSMREMARADRSAGRVMDDALWGVFSEGWRDGFGCDADHLKTVEDIDICAAAGFNGYTLDPGAHVDNAAGTADAKALQKAADALPWSSLEDKWPDFLRRYAGRAFRFDKGDIKLTDEDVLRAAVKYGRAVAHVSDLVRHLKSVMAGRPFDLEISVDETDSPTTPAEHAIVASELKRLGVTWAGLAPRFLGRFEKGVDYIGDLAAFRADFSMHASIARSLGPYKLSLHSGSDKFAVYPIAAEETAGLVHLKTAGTSWLEALRTVAAADPALFRRIYSLARDRYETDKASYHVSAVLEKTAPADGLSDDQLAGLLDQFDARQVLHVTFGSVLTEKGTDGKLKFRDALTAVLREQAEAYASNLEAHFGRHLRPFVASR
jgi:hypothetical protein